MLVMCYSLPIQAHITGANQEPSTYQVEAGWNSGAAPTHPDGIAGGDENKASTSDWEELCSVVAEALPMPYRLVTPFDDLRAAVAAAFPARLVLLNWWNLTPHEGQH